MSIVRRNIKCHQDLKLVLLQLDKEHSKCHHGHQKGNDDLLGVEPESVETVTRTEIKRINERIE